jgi:hypothetical protein
MTGPVAGELLGELAVLGATGRSGSAICVTDTTAWASHQRTTPSEPVPITAGRSSGPGPGRPTAAAVVPL